MKKPSIFSKDYERKKRKRRLIYTGVLGSAVFICLLGTSFIVKSKKEFKLDEKVNVEENKPEKESINVEKDIAIEKDKAESEKKIVDVDGIIVNLELTKNGKINFAKTLDKNIGIDISPNKEKILLSDNIKQKNIIVDTNGEIKDISDNTYTSKKGDKFIKEDVLSKYKGYIWSKDAKFLDNENIVYVTNRPYFSQNTRNEYIGMTNIETLKNKIIVATKSEQIKLGKLTDKGIEVNAKNENYILNKSGNIVK